jgi:hypothetical protein
MNDIVTKVLYYSYYYEDWMEIEMVWTTKLEPVTVMEYPGLEVKYEWGKCEWGKSCY